MGDRRQQGPTLTDLLEACNKEYEDLKRHSPSGDPFPPDRDPADNLQPSPQPSLQAPPSPQGCTHPPVKINQPNPAHNPPVHNPPLTQHKTASNQSNPWPRHTTFLGPLTPHTTPQDIEHLFQSLSVPLTKTSIFHFEAGPFALVGFLQGKHMKSLQKSLKTKPLWLTDSAGVVVPLQVPEQPLFKVRNTAQLAPCLFQGKIIMVDSIVHLPAAIQTLLNGSFSDFNENNQITVGLDTEWKPNFQKNTKQNPTSLLQLATSDVAVLIRVHLLAREYYYYSSLVQELAAVQQDILHHQQHLNVSGPVNHPALLKDNLQWEQGIKKDLLGFYKSLEKPTKRKTRDIKEIFESQYPNASKSGFTMPTVLSELLISPYIHKVGLEIHNDLQKLTHNLQCSLPLQSCHDIKTHPFYGFSEKKSLAGLSHIFLHYQLNKKARLTNWENPILTETQIVYAATDAWISLKVYNEMVHQFTQ